MLPLLSQEEINIRIDELKRNDPPFPDLTLPDWLPVPIKDVVLNFANMIKRGENCSSRIQKIDTYRSGIAYIGKALPAFRNKSTKDVWVNLLTLRPEKIKNATIKHFSVEMRAQKVAQVILHMENHIEHVLNQYDYCQQCIKNEQSILDQTDNLIQTKIAYYMSKPSSQIYIDNDQSLKFLIEERQRWFTNISQLKAQLGSRSSFQTEFMPASQENQKKNNSKGRGEAKAYACFLHTAFKHLYGTPHLKKISILIEALFNKTYTETDISSHASHLKKSQIEHPSVLQNTFQIFLSSAIQNNSLGLWGVASSLYK